MITISRLILVSFLGAAFAGCAGPEPKLSGASLARGVVFEFPSPETLGRRVESAQLVTAEVAGQKILFEARVSVTKEQFQLVGTDPMGRRAMSVDYVDGSYRAQKADWVPALVDPNRVLADFMLIFWPRAPLAKTLAASGVELIDQGQTRIIRLNGHELVTIDYKKTGWRGHARLKNHSLGYAIDVRSAELGR